MDVRQLGQLGAAHVGHDEPGALGDGALDQGPEDGWVSVVFAPEMKMTSHASSISRMEPEAAEVESAAHRRDRARVAEAGAVVHAVGAEPGPDHPHEDVVVLVAALGGGEAARAPEPWVSRIRLSSCAARLRASSQVASRKALYQAGGVATRLRTSSSSPFRMPVSGACRRCAGAGGACGGCPSPRSSCQGPRGAGATRRSTHFSPSCIQPFRISGVISRSRCIGKSYPNRPFTQVEP